MDDTTYIFDFANRLYSLREGKNVTARDMSLSLGKSATYIYDLESGKSFPSMLNFLHICEYFDITPSEFFDYTNKTPVLDYELMEKIKKIDKQSKEYILKLINEMAKKP